MRSVLSILLKFVVNFLNDGRRQRCNGVLGRWGTEEAALKIGESADRCLSWPALGERENRENGTFYRFVYRNDKRREKI